MGKPKRSSNKRKFGNKVFTFEEYTSRKTYAESRKKTLQRKGYYVRIVPVPGYGGYNIYVREFAKMPQYSVTVITGSGRMLGTPWFSKSSQARNYMKKKMKRMRLNTADIASIVMHTWRKDDTIKTQKKKSIKRL